MNSKKKNIETQIVEDFEKIRPAITRLLQTQMNNDKDFGITIIRQAKPTPVPDEYNYFEFRIERGPGKMDWICIIVCVMW